MNRYNDRTNQYEGMTDTDLLHCILGCDDNVGKLQTISEIMSAKRQEARDALNKFLGGNYANS